MKYMYLRKKRYLLYFSLAFGVGLANAPTMLLFIPLIILIVLFRCREVADDPIIILLSLLIVFGGFLVCFVPMPNSYLANPPAYMAPTSIVQAFSFSFEWYYFDLKSVFPIVKSFVIIVMWLFLIVPTFAPLLYLAWKRNPHAASAIPPSYTFIKYVLMLVLTILGLIHLYGYDLFTIAFVRRMNHYPPKYLVPLVLVSSWMTYLIGYWLIIFSGRRTESIHDESDQNLYSRGLYVFLVILVFFLPVISLGINFGTGVISKRNRTGVIARDYCDDILRSCEAESVIVVPEIIDIKGTFQGYGSALIYVNAFPQNANDDSSDGTEKPKRTIIDFPTASFLNVTNRIDLEKYLQSVIWGETDSAEIPRTRFSDVKKAPYDRIIQEAFKHQEIALETGKEAGLTETDAQSSDSSQELPRPKTPARVYFLHNSMLFAPQNQLINGLINFVPKGLAYKAVFYDDPEYSAEKIMNENRDFWKAIGSERIKYSDVEFYARESGLEKRFSFDGFILNCYSRLANDAGILCAEHGIALNKPELLKEASQYYELSIEFDADNACAKENLAQYLSNEDENKEKVEKLKREAEVIREQEGKRIKEMIPVEEARKDRETIRQTETILTTFRLILLYGYVRDTEFYRRYVELGYSGIISRLPIEERQPYYALQYKMLNLALSMNPVSPNLHIDKAMFLQGSNAFMHKLQAIVEYKTALDNGAVEKRRLLQEIAASYARLNNPLPAEDYYKRAIKEPSLETDPAKVRASDVEAKFLLLSLYANARYNLEEGLTIAKEINQSTTKDEREIFFRSVEYIFTFMMLANKVDEIPSYVKEFATAYPGWETEIKQSLALLYVRQNRIKEAGKVYEEIMDKTEDKDGTMALALANLYGSQKEWEKLIALNMTAKNPNPLVVSGFSLMKGQAYLLTGQMGKAVEIYEFALDKVR